MIRLALLALLASVALAQTPPRGPSAPGRDAPTERYHEGARAFVDGETERARAAVEAGLRAAPSDARLQALRALIEQEQEEQDQRQGGQDSEDSQNEEGSDESQDEPDPSSNGGQGDQPPPPDDPEAEQDQTRTPPQDPGEDESEGGSDGRRTGQGGATPEGDVEAPQGQMSRAQAERILDAVGGEERLLLEELRRQPTRGRRSDKDW